MVKIGTCGTGAVAQWISGTIRTLASDKIDLYAVATAPGFECEEFAKTYGYKKICGDYDELFNDPEVDIVYIAVPNAFHFDMCKRAIEAGKNVICEKPFMLNYEDAKEIVALAKEKNVFLMEAMWPAFLPIRDLVRKEIANGAIGEIVSGEAVEMDDLTFLPQRFKLEIGGGYMVDNGPYSVGWMTDYFGIDIKDVKCKMRKGDTGVDLEDWLEVEYQNGVRVTIHQAMDIPREDYHEYAKIVGTKGEIRFNTIAEPSKCAVYDKEGNLIKEITVPEEKSNPFNERRGYEHEFIAAAEAIEAGKKECDTVPNAKSLAVCYVMNEARKQNDLIYPFERK